MTHEFAERSLIAERIAASQSDVELSEQGGTWTVTVRRVFAHGSEEVWAMLTEPTQLARWSPVVPDRPLTTPGPARARETPDATEVDVEVLTCDPPRELVHRWGASTLRWTLRAVPDGTQLTLDHSFHDRTQAPSYAAGWLICLAVALLLDHGADVPRVVGSDALHHGWQALYDEFTTRFATSDNEGTS